jgi:hypothetical protein
MLLMFLEAILRRGDILRDRDAVSSKEKLLAHG